MNEFQEQVVEFLEAVRWHISGPAELRTEWVKVEELNRQSIGGVASSLSNVAESLDGIASAIGQLAKAVNDQES